MYHFRFCVIFRVIFELKTVIFSYHRKISNIHVKNENPCIYKENFIFSSKCKGLKKWR